eukprot:4067764-Amphidinium_carterae.1
MRLWAGRFAGMRAVLVLPGGQEIGACTRGRSPKIFSSCPYTDVRKLYKGAARPAALEGLAK